MTASELVLSTLKDNCGLCRAAHLIRRGDHYGISEYDLRTAAVDLGIVGVTEGGQRYISLPSHAGQLEPWARWCSDVVDYHRNQEEVEMVGDGTPFNDELPEFM